MNLAVQQPTRIIRLNGLKLKTKPLEISGNSINFYQLNSNNFELPDKFTAANCGKFFLNELSKGKIGVDGTAKTEFGETVKTEFDKTVKIEFGETAKPEMLDSRFFLESLRNDMRVKLFEVEDNIINVHFVTVNDAISFYKQHFYLVKMNFAEEVIFGIPDDNEENNGQESSSLSDTNIIYSLKPFKITEDEPVQTYQTEKEFFLRIEFFNRMKGLYSKNEIKKLNLSEQSDGERDVDEGINHILMNAKELAVGPVTNVVLQSKIKDMMEEQICSLIKAIGDDIAAICATKYGAYTIQTLILACSTKKSQLLICKYFGENGKYLFCHEIGNYSIQRILLFNEEYVFEIIKRDLKAIIENSLGIRVLKRCLGLLKNRRGELEEMIERVKTKKNTELCKELLGLLN